MSHFDTRLREFLATDHYINEQRGPNAKISHLFAPFPLDVPKALENVLPEFDRLREVSPVGRPHEERDKASRQKGPRDGAEAEHGFSCVYLSVCDVQTTNTGSGRE